MQRASLRGRHVPLPGHRTGLCNFGEKLGLGASEPRAGRLDRLFRFVREPGHHETSPHAARTQLPTGARQRRGPDQVDL